MTRAEDRSARDSDIDAALEDPALEADVFARDCGSREVLQNVTSRWGLLALGALGTGLAYLWNTNIVAAWGAAAAASVTYLTPVVGLVLGVAVLGERPAWNQPLGGLIVLAGIVLSRRDARPGPHPPDGAPDHAVRRSRTTRR